MSMSSQEVKDLAAKVVMTTYGRYDLVIAKGDGCRVWDPEGKEYLDFVGGLAVTSLGHSNLRVAEAIYRQAQTLVHVSNLYYTKPMVRLAQLLTENCFADRVFFCNSGAEANEAALKLARKYSRDKYGEGRFHVITMEESFHGRTMATLAATAQEKIQKGFEPLMPGFQYVPLGDIKALEFAITDRVCAVLVEPIQGEGGINEPGGDYLAKVAELCRKNDILLIFDEVQVGLGRTGKLFAHEHYGVTPDIMTLAKAIANGLPMGACLATEQVASHFGPGAHATTFGGTPLVSAAGVAVLETMLEPGFLDHVVLVGNYFKDRLNALAERYEFVKQAKGRGLILGLELTFPGAGVVNDMMERGFLINCTHDTVLRFLPPLQVTSTEVDRLIEALEESIQQAAEEG
jgi:acetylornithine/N-succinyldiaminopimelate aminotransferase